MPDFQAAGLGARNVDVALDARSGLAVGVADTKLMRLLKSFEKPVSETTTRPLNSDLIDARVIAEALLGAEGRRCR